MMVPCWGWGMVSWCSVSGMSVITVWIVWTAMWVNSSWVSEIFKKIRFFFGLNISEVTYLSPPADGAAA